MGRIGEKLKVATKLYVFRCLENLKSSEVAQRVGISQSYYSQIESGYVVPKRDLLEKLGELFNQPPDELLKRVKI